MSHPADEEPLPPFERELRRETPARLLPQSETAEESALCCCIMAPRETFQLCDELGIAAGHFHRPAREQIFRVIRQMHDANKPIDNSTVCIELHNRNLIESVGGFAYISQLDNFLPSALNARVYLDTLCDKHTLRQVATIGTRFHERAHEDQDDVDGVLEDFEKQVMAIRPIGRNVRCYSGKDIARMAMDSLSRRLEKHDEIAGLTTGFPDLDMKTDGMHDTELIVLAGRPGTGKSSMAGQIAEYLALDRKTPVGIFSLEMGAQLLSERCISSRARVDTAPWRSGKVPTNDELRRIETARDEYHEAPIFVEELSDATVQHLRTAARRMVQQHGVRLIIVDSLSKLRSNSKQGRDNREREVSEAVGGCKEIAKELNLPVIVIAHLRRPDHQEKFGTRPSLERLRESGAIEQDADSVWMLYQREDGSMGLYLPKQRAGAADEECGFWFQKQWTRFKPAETAEQEADAVARKQRELPL